MAFLLLQAPQIGFPADFPRPAHVVVVIEENHTYAQVIGSPQAPYLTWLARHGASFTDAHGVTHPSAPNYFAIFAGRRVVGGDDCPARGIPSNAPNIGSELLAAHLGYVAYSESLPSPGFRGCWAGTYARKHAPWVSFSNLPAASHQPLTTMKPYDALPTVTFIVPNVDHDMHDGSVKAGDSWFEHTLSPLVRWAGGHNTLLIVTWDEGFDANNTIPTIFYGPMVKHGQYSERLDGFGILRTLEAMYGLEPLGAAAGAMPVRDVWKADALR